MKEVKATKPENQNVYGVISLGYDKIILPLADATRLMDCFAKAEKFETEWRNNKTETFIGGRLPLISMELLSGTNWLAGKLNGEKECNS